MSPYRVPDEAVRRLAGSPEDSRQWLVLDLCDAKGAVERAERELAEARAELERVRELLHEVAISGVERDAGWYLVVQIPTRVMLQIKEALK